MQLNTIGPAYFGTEIIGLIPEKKWNWSDVNNCDRSNEISKSWPLLGAIFTSHVG